MNIHKILLETVKYDRISGKLEGLEVSNDVPNISSIKATLEDYTILKGIRKVPMKEFNGPKSVFYAKDDFDRSKTLSKEIEKNKIIKPLIIVVDSEGPYILEGGHRYVALYYLNKKYLPALIVLDNEDFNS